MLYFCLYVQLRRGSVAGYTTDESWHTGKKRAKRHLKAYIENRDGNTPVKFHQADKG